MKLSEVRPCDNCGGPIAPIFNVIRVSPAIFNPREVNQVLGMTQMFGGALGLAEVMAGGNDAVKVAIDDPAYKDSVVDIYLCNKCCAGGVCIGELTEKVSAIKAKQGGDIGKD
jgi:hypothetical protein